MADWQNRIVGTGEVDPHELTPNPLNWRRHPSTQQAAVREALERLGWVQQVIVNRRTGRLIDGHLRVELARERGERVPVLYVDLDESEERLALATLDPLAALAEADDELLAQLLEDVQLEDGALLDVLADVAGSEAEGDRAATPDPGELEEAEPRRVADDLREEYGTEPGQVWASDTVTLVIGDATDRSSYPYLPGEVEMVWTDPPYGVDLGAKNRYLQSVERARRDTVGLKNDDLDEDELRELLGSAFAVALEHQRPGGAWYVTAPPGPLQCVFGGVLTDLGIWRQTIIWAKNNPTFSPLGATYHWGHEPMFYGWKPGGQHVDNTGRTEATVWQIDRPAASLLHPSTKPVELVARAIKNSTDPGHLILDPFAGSGTTAVAAVQLGRRAYVIELDPAYAAVILHRLAELGLELELVDTRGG